MGGASGGVWKTTNAGTSWTPLTDQQASLSIGSLAIAPSDHNVIYAGTGEPNASCDSYFGAGILKSTDGGAIWALVGNASFNGTSISRIVVHPTNPSIVWATNTTGVAGSFICAGGGGSTTGVWKSGDGGSTWTRYSNGNADRVIIDPANSNTLYAAFYNSGIRKSTDGGVTWPQLAGGLPAASAIRRGDIAIRASDGNLFAIFEDFTTRALQGIYRSTNGGTNWAPTTATPASASLCSSYCWYFIGIEIAPDGGIWARGFDDYRSGDSGGTWALATSGVHVDNHAIAFGTASTVAWVGSDGGAWKSASISSPSWTSMNTGLQLMQFYPGASLHPTNANYLMAGAQDNGSDRYTGTTTWTQVYGWDGGWTGIDQSNPAVQYVEHQNLYIYKSTNTGASFNPAVTGLGDANAGPFIAAFEICPGSSQNLITGSTRIWRTSDQAANWVQNSPNSMAGGASFNALAWAKSDATCNTYFAGATNGQVWRTTVGGGTAAANWSNISTGLPVRGIQDFAVLASNANTIYVGLSGYAANVWKTTNALAVSPSWVSVSTGLPSVPVNAVLIDPTDSNTIYIGTDAGVFRSQNAGTSWAAFSSGLPKVPIFDLQANSTTNTLVAFTHGRGAWKLTTVPPGEAGLSSPLRIAKSSGNYVFSWGAPAATCGAASYDLFVGGIAGLRTTGYGHDEYVCRSVGTSMTFPQSDPGLGNNSYYLIVADNGLQEGSYGRNSSGTEIPQGGFICEPAQNLSVCP